MTRCSKCGKEVSETAITCPHCGERNPGESESSKKAWGILMAILWGLFLLGWAFSVADMF